MSMREQIAKNCIVSTVLPTTVDTPANRKAMPSEDYRKWIPVGPMSRLITRWARGEDRPENSAFVKLALNERGVLQTYFL